MPSPKEFAHLQIPLKSIEKATNNFDDENLIGQGGFGRVYKGNLLQSGQSIIIVARRLHHDYGQGDIEFWTEIMMLASLKHDNVVSIVGFCDENDEKIIINKYEAKKSLDKSLSSAKLTWMQRLQICVDVARVLKYIHYDDGHDFSVIHRNIKSSKILLDDNWKPKLCGFQTSLKSTKARRHRILLAEVIGTIGYVDPMYEKTGFVTHKSDVYSLGVILFEVMCGRRAFGESVEKELSESILPFKDHKSSRATIITDAIKRALLCYKGTRQKDLSRETNEHGRRLKQYVTQTYEGDLDKNTDPLLPSKLPSRHSQLFRDGQASSYTNVQRSSSGPSSYTKVHSASSGQPSSFTNVKPSSHGNPSSSSNVQPSSTGHSSSSTGHLSFWEQRPLSGKEKLVSNAARTLCGQNKIKLPDTVNEKEPLLSYQQLQLDQSMGYLPSIEASSLKVINDPLFTINPSKQTNILPVIEAASSQEQRFLLHPLFTMKRLDRYIHSPNEEFLAQLAKSHYEEGNLIDIINPDLYKQMDLKSFDIFSETAYSCLKEQRSQRPVIDQIVTKLERALELQRKHEILKDDSKVASEVEGASANHFKGKNLGHLEIPLSDIKLATDNFADAYQIGSGGYGKVYRAKLVLPIEKKNNHEHSRKLTTVAIKRISIREDMHGKEGFVAEIDLLTNCKHPNIVSLLGFCNEGSHMILVYEYVPNGSLGDYLERTDNLTYLTWAQRIKICMDIARGLNYLHTKVEDERRIIHRDIKSDNILLGKNWEAKIADFGLSRFYPEGHEANTLNTDNIAGTYIYLDPEYQNTGKLKKEVDIYSFGVVLFEIMSGKTANDPVYISEDIRGLAPVARRRFKEGTINKMVDPKIMEEVDELISTLNKGPNQDSLNTFISIAYQCLSETQNERPTAEVIMRELEKALSFQENHKDNLQISFEDIKKATRNFSHGNHIGGGGFGKVYKGQLTHANGSSSIAAKRLDKSQGQGEHELLTELEILFEYKHENIIGLVGYCNEKHEKIIVYEHASNECLDKHLRDNSLTWMKRLKICIDIASGLAFLHGGALTKEMVIHRDIKCANILLNDDLKAKISDFGLSIIIPIDQEMQYAISNLVGTIGYVDPLYNNMGFLTKESDIYSFGVVLFEILYGKLLVPDTRNFDQQFVTKILNYIHDEEKLDWIVSYDTRRTMAPKSLSTFRMIVSRCLDSDRKRRPTAEEVLQQLNIAMEFQEDYQVWERKLPKGYEEIIQMSKSRDSLSAKKKKDLYKMFSEGLLLQEEKVWFSLGDNGAKNKMISASEFSYINDCSPHEWQSITESKFEQVAEVLDTTNLMIKIQIRTDLLSPNVTYGVRLLFKFCNSRKVSSKLAYVNLKYKNGSETSHAYFATWRDDNWMAVELFRFLNHKEFTTFTFLLESLSTYYCGDEAIYVEGIEFRAFHNDTESDMNVDQVLQVRTSEEGEEFFSVTDMNGEKYLFLPVKAILHDFTNVKLFTSRSSAECRFPEEIELLPQQVFRINCAIKSHLLSPDTEYECFLVFKLSEQCGGLQCPVKVQDLLQRKNEEAWIVYFISPSSWNVHDFTKTPTQREDGWMEVNVWNFNSKHNLKNGCLHINLKLTSYEGTMSGLIVHGLTFFPR